MELIDIYDEHMNLIETGVSKDRAHKEGLRHKVSHIWIYTKDGYILFQKRAMKQKFMPGKFDTSIAGHAGMGDTFLSCAKREAVEELGIDLDDYKDKLTFVNIFVNNNTLSKRSNITDNEFNGIFLLELETKEDFTFNFNDGEVSEIKWFQISELSQKDFNTPDFGFVPKDKLYRDIIIGSIKRAFE